MTAAASAANAATLQEKNFLILPIAVAFSVAGIIFMAGTYYGRVIYIEEKVADLINSTQALETLTEDKLQNLQEQITTSAFSIAGLQTEFKNYLVMRQQTMSQRDRQMEEVDRRMERLENVLESLREVGGRLQRIEEAVKPPPSGERPRHE